MNKRDLLALYLIGTYCHRTGTRPPSCLTTRQLTIYVTDSTKKIFSTPILGHQLNTYFKIFVKRFEWSPFKPVFCCFSKLFLFIIILKSSFFILSFAQLDNFFCFLKLRNVYFSPIIFEVIKKFLLGKTKWLALIVLKQVKQEFQGPIYCLQKCRGNANDLSEEFSFNSFPLSGEDFCF